MEDHMLLWMGAAMLAASLWALCFTLASQSVWWNEFLGVYLCWVLLALASQRLPTAFLLVALT